MRILKRYSANYQVIELELEVDHKEEFAVSVALQEMEDIAKEELAKMVNVAEEISAPAQSKQVFPSSNKPAWNSSPQPNTGFVQANGSPKQLAIIKKNFPKLVGIAQGLNIQLATDSDIANLTQAEISSLIGKLFNN